MNDHAISYQPGDVARMVRTGLLGENTTGIRTWIEKMSVLRALNLQFIPLASIRHGAWGDPRTRPFGPSRNTGSRPLPDRHGAVGDPRTPREMGS